MARKLLEKAGLVQVPPSMARPAEEAAPGEAGRAKTAPGSMLHFMTSQSAAIREVETLREQLAAFDDALPVRRLDPRRVRASAWANRHPASFEAPEFAALREEIAAAGGNVQPIKVRPLGPRGGGVGPSNPPSHGGDPQGVGRSNPPADYEIVFGHRRHRACLDLGLPVLALVEEVSEQELFVAMERENRGRKDLSAWEQGTMYARALDQGLYASNRQLAAAIGRDLGDVGKALALARLPEAVVEAFPSPLDLQYRWAKPLAQAQQRDPEGLLARAKALRESGRGLTSKQVLDLLLDPGADPPAAVAEPAVVGRTRRGVATFSVDEQGHTVVRLDRFLSDDRRRQLAKLLGEFLSGS